MQFQRSCPNTILDTEKLPRQEACKLSPSNARNYCSYNHIHTYNHTQLVDYKWADYLSKKYNFQFELFDTDPEFG